MSSSFVMITTCVSAMKPYMLASTQAGRSQWNKSSGLPRSIGTSGVAVGRVRIGRLGSLRVQQRRRRIGSMPTTIRCRVLAVVIAIVISGIAAAQEQKIEYGNKSEMRDAKIVFVDTGTNLDFRENVVALLKRELSGVQVADRLDDTVDLILQFAIHSDGDRKGAASLLVLARPSAPDSARLVAKYADTKNSVWTRKLSTVLVRRFIRDYLTANRK
jgi:hypothetical protein